MKTSRKDIMRDKRKTLCLNSSLLGYSRHTLQYGDYFNYIETYTDGTTGIRFAKCHGRVKPSKQLGNEPIKWYILAQVISRDMQCDMERWVDSENVISTIQKEYVNPLVCKLFEEYEVTK